MSRKIVSGDSASMPVAKNGNNSIRTVTANGNRAEMSKVYGSVKILSPAVGPKTDSARISAAVDAVMERGSQGKK